MELRILKRQPWRFLICVLFLGVVTAAGLFFSLQTYIDGLNLDYVKEYYACTGTLMEDSVAGESYGSNSPEVRPLPQEAIDLLVDSGLVRQVDIRGTLSASIEGLRQVPRDFYCYSARNLCILDGRVRNHDLGDGTRASERGLYRYGDCYLMDVTVYMGPPELKSRIAKVDNLAVVYRVPMGEEDPFATGGRYLITGFTCIAEGAASDGTFAHVEVAGIMFGRHREECSVYTETLYPKAVLPLEDDTAAEEISAILSERGWDKFTEQEERLDSVFTVRTVRDMNLLLPVAQEEMFYASGRGILPGDKGKRVCVISEELALENGLQIGDVLPLALAEGAYTIAGYETGLPLLGETLTLPYEEPEAYEIIGTYAFLRHDALGDPFQFSYNDIFIPAKDGETLAGARPYTMSFQVMGEDYDAFLDAVVPQIEKLGCTVRLSASRWEAVEGIYAQIEARRRRMLAAAAVTLAGCCLLYVALIGLLYRREFALRKLLGTPARRAWRAYSVPFGAATFLGSTGAILAIQALYGRVLRAQMEQIVPGNAPDSVQVLVFLLTAAVAQAVLCLLLLRLYCHVTQRRAVRILLK